jgi:hypothetical protein
VASYFLTAFGRPDREKTCACERQQATNVAQALHLSNGDTVNDKLRAPKGAIDKLLDGGATDAQALDALYVAALARHPSAEEQSRALHALTDRPPDAGTPVAASAQAPPAAPDRRMARHALLEDLFWAVLTDRDFLFNH